MASLGFVYGLLLGNCGYQTDRKIYDQSEIAVRLRSSRDTRAARATKFIDSLREKKKKSAPYLVISYYVVSFFDSVSSIYLRLFVQKLPYSSEITDEMIIMV